MTSYFYCPQGKKRGLPIGMGMTEKQGGSDVLSTLQAERLVDGSYRLVGHKWFFSKGKGCRFALARAKGGLS